MRELIAAVLPFFLAYQGFMFGVETNDSTAGTLGTTFGAFLVGLYFSSKLLGRRNGLTNLIEPSSRTPYVSPGSIRPPNNLASQEAAVSRVGPNTLRPTDAPTMTVACSWCEAPGAWVEVGRDWRVHPGGRFGCQACGHHGVTPVQREATQTPYVSPKAVQPTDEATETTECLRCHEAAWRTVTTPARYGCERCGWYAKK